MTVLSKLPLSGALAKINEKKYDTFCFFTLSTNEDFTLFWSFTNIVMPIPGILKNVKLIHELKVNKKI